VETQFTISGTEYGGFPSPLTGVVVYLPAGTKLHPQGFAPCSNAILESHEVQKCPKRSVASPKGEVLGVVSFGSSRVQEKASVQAFFASGNKLAFFTEGTSPASIEILSTGSFSGASKPFGQKLNAVVPLVETVPGAPFASGCPGECLDLECLAELHERVDERCGLLGRNTVICRAIRQ
jgi:hypothetical protein